LDRRKEKGTAREEQGRKQENRKAIEDLDMRKGTKK
jgi:hypothetical protein